MTENRRIFWNIVATYGMSLYALVIGIFCGRWSLMVLGEVDYGLLGLIGSALLGICTVSWMSRMAGVHGNWYNVSCVGLCTARTKE